jgi:RHS repeat-associated protein
MNATVRKALLLFLLLAASVTPAVAAGVAANRYLVVLKSGPAGVSEVTDAQISTLGGTVEFRLPSRLEVTLSDRAAEVLRAYPAVKYVQRVAAPGPADDDSSVEQSSILRLHPKAMALDPPSWTSGTFKYDGNGNIYAIGLSGESGVTAHTYTYDNLSRLTQATNVVAQTEKFYYDEYGNMTRHDVGATSTTIALDTSHNNRLQATTTVQYDAVGNLTSDETAAYKYDPFSQLREKDFSIPAGTTDKEIYLYTPSDERIGVKQNNTWTWSIRDFGGKVLRQYQSSATQPASSWLWMEDYVYRDGLLFGADRPAEEGGRRYMHLDHLGTPRLVTGAGGVKVAEHELAPFGIEPTPLWEDSTTHGFDREDPMRFTGHERDFAQLSRMVTTPYLDYMHARFYSATVGRFLSVDPVLDMKMAMTNPQGWNRYSYVRNNPVRFTDPTGKYTCSGGKDDCAVVNAMIAFLPSAAANLKANDPHRKQLLTLAAAFGKLGDSKSKISIVTINPVDKNGKQSLGSAFGAPTSTGVAISILNIASTARSKGGDLLLFNEMVGGNLVHEGTHKLQNLSSVIRSRAEHVGQERDAYAAEAGWFAGTSYDAPNGTWTNVGGYNQQAINQGAEASTAAACGTQCPP